MLGARLDAQAAALAAVRGDIDRLKRRNHLTGTVRRRKRSAAVPFGARDAGYSDRHGTICRGGYV
jgi:hypothetical protein